MNHHVRYRLYHKINKKYVAWPHGRGYVERPSEKLMNVCNLMPMLRIENLAWGASDIIPVLEIHSVSKRTGEVKNIYQLNDYDNSIYQYKQEVSRRRAA